jgi:hypothetical protein
MKHTAIPALVLLSVFIGFSSQGSETRSISLTNIATPSDCPPHIEVRALHTASGQAKSIDNSDSAGIAQRLRVTVSNSQPVEIVQTRITVRGHTGKGELSPANSLQTGSSEATKSFNLALKIGVKQQASTKVLLPGFTSIISVNLDSVVFADDSSWHPSEGKVCHIPVHTSLNLTNVTS